jgi:hypothetical protein
MLSALLSIDFNPGIRGILVTLVMFVFLVGGTYLLVGTNLGARLGFLIVGATLAGWMMLMCIVWVIYGIGLKGPEPKWIPNEPIAIVRDGALLDRAEVLETSVNIDGLDPTAAAEKVSDTLVEDGWTKLDDADPARGKAVAASDEILQIEAEEFAAGEYVSVAVFDKGGERYPKIGESLDFLAFWHKPRYSVVQVAPVVQQRTEPGRAPARVQIDTTKPHRYVVMIRDLGAKRRPGFLIGFGSALIFFLMVWMLHRRETLLRDNLALKSAAA